MSLKSFLFLSFSSFFWTLSHTSFTVNWALKTGQLSVYLDHSFTVNWALKTGQLSVYLDHLLYSSSTLHCNNKPMNQKMTLSFSVPDPCRKKHCRDLDKMQRTMAALLRPTRGTDRAVWSRTCRSRKSHLKLCPLRKP